MSKQIKNKNKSHLFEGGGFSAGGDFGISGTVGFINGMKSSFDDVKQKSENYEDQINNSQIADLSKINDLDTLEDYAASIKPIDYITTDDLTGNLKQRFGKYLSTSGQAAQAGSNYGPWGLLIGSVVGQIGAGLSDTFSRKKARNERRELNDRIDLINKQNQDLLANKASNIMQNQLNDQQWNYIAALGGNLHSNSTTWSNGLNYIGAGGSHESNPNDGVAISIAPDGLENKVEEGEVVWNDNYVFSKRLTIPEKDKKANKWKGKTYADVAKELMDNSEERPNDPITLRGLDDALSRLRDSQDELKAKQEERKIKKAIASMPPEMLAQLQQQAQQPTEEELMQQQAMEQMPQEQMSMVDPSMQQPMMEQPPMYAKGGHLLKDAGNVKAVSGRGFFTPLPQPQTEGINNLRIPTLEEMKIAKDTALTDYINKQAEYVNVKDAQRYGGFYNDVDKVNEYLSGNTPMDVNNVAQGVANQQSKEAGRVYLGRVPVKKNYGLDENSRILDRDNEASVNFFLKNNPNLNLDSDTIYFYSRDKNDEANKNKFLKADKVNQEIYDKNSVENISRISGINFNRANTMAKGGHLHADDPTILRRYQMLENEYPTFLLNDYQNIKDYNYAKSIGFTGTLDDYINYKSNQKIAKASIPEADLSFIENKYKPGYISNKVADTDDVIDALGRKSVFKNSEERKKYAEKDLQKNINKITKTAKAGDQDNSSNGTDWSTYARFAPVVGSAIGAISSMFNKPDYDNPKRIERIAQQIASPISPKYIGDYLRYRPLDEAYYLNQLNAQQNAANNNIIGLSNGNRSMALASMLANDYNYNNQRGAAYRQGLEYNEAQRQRVGEFNRGTNQFNAQQYLAAAEQNARNKAQAANLIASAAQMREGIANNYGNSVSANWTNFFNNVGDVGRDKMNWNMAKDIYDYNVGRDGTIQFNGRKYAPVSNNAKCGGYLTIKTNNRRKG